MGSPIGVDGTEYGLIEDGAGEGGLGIGQEGGGVGDGALSMRSRRLMMRSGRSGVGADGAGRAPFGGKEARVLGDAGMVGRLGLPLLVLRRCREGRELVTSSGRGGRADEGGWVAGGVNEKREARNVKDSLKVVFVTGAECGCRVGSLFNVSVGTGDGSGVISIVTLPNSSTPV